MTSEQFTYWLQGYFELGHLKTLDEKQVQIIKDHLNLVFKKVTPDYMGSSHEYTAGGYSQSFRLDGRDSIQVEVYNQPSVTC